MRITHKVGLISAAIFAAGILAGCGTVAPTTQPKAKSSAANVPATTQSKNQQAVPNVPVVTGNPEEAVRQFYAKLFTDPQTTQALVDQNFTSVFRQQLEKRAPGTPYAQGLGLNCAQDAPDDSSQLTLTPVPNTGGMAVYSVSVLKEWKSFSVSLIPEGGVWKINAITCQ